MGKGGGSAKQEVTEYYMSIHAGVCTGPVDAITGIYIGEKLAWEGEVTEEGGIVVNQPQLFGGPKKEGGVGGVVYYLPGGQEQTMPDALAQRFGVTEETCPGFRGIASIFFVGGSQDGSIAPPSGGGGDVSGGSGGGGTSGGGGASGGGGGGGFGGGGFEQQEQ